MLWPLPMQVVEDTNTNHAVDDSDTVLKYVRFGLWDHAFNTNTPTGVINDNSESTNFIGCDSRRFYLRIKDTKATGSTITADWYTQKSDGTDDDHPGTSTVTLTQTGTNTGVFVSKALMLVADDVDNNFAPNTGLVGTGTAVQGAADHRLRRAALGDKMCFSYTMPITGAQKATASVPIFDTSNDPGPDKRKQLTVNIVNYLAPAVGSNPPQPYGTSTYINSLFSSAQDLWTQVGLKINQGSNVQRAIPSAALAMDGTYQGSANTTQEAAILNDLIPITADNTLTVIILPLGGANAYTTIAQRTNVTLGDRYFIFINNALDINDLTLAHELFHALYNRFDDSTATQQYFPFNTEPPDSFGVTLPDVRIYRRIQAITITPTDWLRQGRTGRFPIGSGIGTNSATTGNTLIQNY